MKRYTQRLFYQLPFSLCLYLEFSTNVSFILFLPMALHICLVHQNIPPASSVKVCWIFINSLQKFCDRYPTSTIICKLTSNRESFYLWQKGSKRRPAAAFHVLSKSFSHHSAVLSLNDTHFDAHCF